MYEYKCTLVKVVDGDTVDIDIDLGFDVVLKNQRVRLVGIDAPESRTRDLVEKQFGLLAKNKVIEVLEKANDLVLVCKEYDSKGKFGRILGDIYADGISLCGRLVTGGYVSEYHGGNKSAIEKQHLVNRERLIKEGIITLD